MPSICSPGKGMECMEKDGEEASFDDAVREGEGEENITHKPMVVLLVGLPGSGKSTFCDEIMKISARPWVRVCQDIIGIGKSGTKDQCLAVSATALNQGKNVLIDRCNINRDQRAEFLKLGNNDTQKHAIVLDLPVKTCVSRSVARTGHEGNLQGGKAAAVVNQMARNKELPKLSEGFNRITVCRKENDVETALRTYGLLGMNDSLPGGFFGQENLNQHVQTGIMKFFKKVDTSVSSENFPTLAFPSISTADFRFNLQKASDIIVEKVEEFVGQIGNARLVLVDISHESKILSLVKKKASEKNIDPCKFFTFVEDITRLHSKGGLRCDATESRRGGVNAAIFNAAGSEFEVATKERAKSLAPGEALIVPLSASSPLFSREGITHVIHVLGPNMNPMRPDCLNGDYVEGCTLLRRAYSSLFEGFISILESGEVAPGSFKSSSHQEKIPATDNQIVKRKAFGDSDTSKKSKSDEKELTSSRQPGQTKAWGSWALALHKIAMHPDKNQSLILEISDDFVVMNDAYPKAQRHLLIIARADGLDGIQDVHREHLSLLRKMHEVGLKWVKKYLEEDNSSLFRLGYHSSPSMRQLHLHVISQDFNSSSLKNKKHWNSFNTPFFLDSIDVMKEVEEAGNLIVKEDCEKLLNKELRCHRCESVHPTIPHLKSHVSKCKHPFPAALIQNSCLFFFTKL